MNKQTLVSIAIALAFFLLNSCKPKVESLDSFGTVDEWVTQAKSNINEINPEGVKDLMETGKMFILVDVRTPEEHAGGFIPGTDFNIDFREMQFRHSELHANLGEHIVVYCQSGHRSNIAAKTLTDLGYKFVYNVAGSMNAWQEAGYPIQMPRR